MKARSFRLRLALMAGGVTAALLIISGALLWRLTREFALDRLDREIRNLGQANLERVVGPSHWARLENALGFVAGEERAPGYVIWVKGAERLSYRSAAWPAGLDPERFPELEGYAGAASGAGVEWTPPRRDRPISRDNPALPLKTPRFFTVEAEGREWRVGLMGNPYVTLALGADLSELNAGLARLRAACAAILAGALVLVVGGAWLLAGRALRPVNALSDAVEGITARGLDQRIAAPAHEPEFGRLVTVFNAMMDRLEKSFGQATRFSADASHELKTPLSLLQAELEQALEASPAGSPLQAACASMLEDVHHLKAIVQKLLLLAQADAGRLKLHRETVDLTALVGNVVEDLCARADGLRLELAIEPGVKIAADADLLEQAVQNLASNALKYTPAGGLVRVSLRREGEGALIEVGNSGQGVAPEDRERIFERFFRAVPSRSGRAEGSGLGLALAREIVRAHDGELCLAPEGGPLTVFRLCLPGARSGLGSGGGRAERE